jgi:lipid-binding SYLF domain-containing protein
VIAIRVNKPRSGSRARLWQRYDDGVREGRIARVTLPPFSKPDMKFNHHHLRLIAAAGCAIALIVAAGVNGAQGLDSRPPGTARAVTSPEAAAMKHINDAAAVVQRMLQEPRMQELLQQAKGVFIVPTYGRAALGVGASGGTGVLVMKRSDGSWSDPVFYNIGGISAGAQVGAEGGPIALVLNNERAVNKFMQKNSFTLNADAGITIVNFSKIAQGSIGDGDVVVWSGTRGLYGNLVAVGVSDIRFHQALTNASYHQSVAPADVLTGKVSNPASQPLRQALAAAPGAAGPSR